MFCMIWYVFLLDLYHPYHILGRSTTILGRSTAVYSLLRTSSVAETDTKLKLYLSTGPPKSCTDVINTFSAYNDTGNKTFYEFTKKMFTPIRLSATVTQRPPSTTNTNFNLLQITNLTLVVVWNFSLVSGVRNWASLVCLPAWHLSQTH
jgi:hypothetical protein